MSVKADFFKAGSPWLIYNSNDMDKVRTEIHLWCENCVVNLVRLSNLYKPLQAISDNGQHYFALADTKLEPAFYSCLYT